MNKKTTTRTGEFSLDENGILIVKVLDGSFIDLDDAIDNSLVVRQITGNKPRLKLWDLRVNWKITKEAREYLLKEDVPGRTIARAVIVKSLANKLISNFLLKFNKSRTPLKIFLDEKEALEWLRSCK